MLCHDAFRLRATRIVPVMRIGAGSFGGVGRCAARPASRLRRDGAVLGRTSVVKAITSLAHQR